MSNYFHILLLAAFLMEKNPLINWHTTLNVEVTHILLKYLQAGILQLYRGKKNALLHIQYIIDIIHL